MSEFCSAKEFGKSTSPTSPTSPLLNAWTSTANGRLDPNEICGVEFVRTWEQPVLIQFLRVQLRQLLLRMSFSYRDGHGEQGWFSTWGSWIQTQHLVDTIILIRHGERQVYSSSGLVCSGRYRPLTNEQHRLWTPAPGVQFGHLRSSRCQGCIYF